MMMKEEEEEEVAEAEAEAEDPQSVFFCSGSGEHISSLPLPHSLTQGC